MVGDRLTVVLDVGKTMAKLTLWTATGYLLARETRANEKIDAGEYVALDALGIEAWMADTLATFSLTASAQGGSIGAIIPVGHGAAAAIVKKGRLDAFPIDYEEELTATERKDYDQDRAPFAETGSPSLPGGLNLGAQLHHLENLVPDLIEGDAQIIPWAQYWAWRLSGVAASEVTSLGCHTDLWNPTEQTPSRLARTRGWADRIPPVRRAADVLGPITEEWAVRCGIPTDVEIYCGLHDSNAALLAARGFPEIADSESTVLSTGTWFVAMRSPADGAAVDVAALSEARDCLVNVDAYGKPVPSARFMGGREIELLSNLDTRRIDIKPDQPALVAGVSEVLEAGTYLLPTFAPGFGPFAGHRGRWVNELASSYARRAAVCLYAALVADVSLDLIGSHDRILVEGRFAEAEVFVRALASLRPNDVIYRANAHNDVSYGALRLLNPNLKPAGALERIEPLKEDIQAYRAIWRRDVHATELAA